MNCFGQITVTDIIIIMTNINYIKGNEKMIYYEMIRSNIYLLDEIELVDYNDALLMMIQQEFKDYLYSCITSLTIIQQRRLYDYYFNNMKKVDIAKKEGVSEGTIRKSIDQSLFQLRRKINRYLYI